MHACGRRHHRRQHHRLVAGRRRGCTSGARGSASSSPAISTATPAPWAIDACSRPSARARAHPTARPRTRTGASGSRITTAAASRVSVRTGSVDRVIPMPVPRPSSCSFGGVGYDTLYVTSVSSGLDPRVLQEAPLSGALFALRRRRARRAGTVVRRLRRTAAPRACVRQRATLHRYAIDKAVRMTVIASDTGGRCSPSTSPPRGTHVRNPTGSRRPQRRRRPSRN